MFSSENPRLGATFGDYVAANDPALSDTAVPPENSQCDPVALPTGDHREPVGNSWIAGLGGLRDEPTAFSAVPAKEEAQDDEIRPEGRAQANARLRQRMSERYVAAREINGWSQSEAAGFLGYSNPTQLSLIEQGKRLPPHETMLRASTVYGVSLDFLYARADDPDIDRRLADRQAAARHIRDLLERQAGTLTDAIHLHLAQDTPVSLAPAALIEAADGAIAAIGKFVERNEGFDEMPAGALLERCCAELRHATERCRRDRVRHERVLKLALQRPQVAANEPQLAG